ncbi:hypothetical protein BGC33_00490, partial [Bathymodiolus thermophilus thioautotrophic gill symbiont]
MGYGELGDYWGGDVSGSDGNGKGLWDGVVSAVFGSDVNVDSISEGSGDGFIGSEFIAVDDFEVGGVVDGKGKGSVGIYI